jgi:hypothetical protein
MILRKSASTSTFIIVRVALFHYIQFQLDIESFSGYFPTIYSILKIINKRVNYI